MPDLQNYDIRRAEDRAHVVALVRVVLRCAFGMAVAGVLGLDPGLGLLVVAVFLSARWVIRDVALSLGIRREIRQGWREHAARHRSGELDASRADVVAEPVAAEESE